ncbi:BA14K family protein [Pararhizobium sp. DWP1-1-3]|uniref:BA14K family protein n=1 Tax=Pararhizobium sp. DWP1-1-3 TaxID=2804652 RepID=UPI003CF58E6B
MTYPILPVLGVTLSLTFIAGSVMAIPNFGPAPEPKKLGNIDITSLWTSRPVSIDRSKQSFERLPALVVQQPETDRMDPAPQEIVTGTGLALRQDAQPHGIGQNEIVGEAPYVGSGTAVTAWCAERYRSYRASDNTYQPYGGARRQCEPPFAAAERNSTTSDVVQISSNVEEIGHGGEPH